MERSLIIITASILISFISGIESTNFIIRNNCPYTIWPATLANRGIPELSSTGFELGQGQSTTIGAPNSWVGRIWARTFCGTGSGGFTCPIGDCGTGQVSCNGNSGATPASLAEIQLNKYNNHDYYDVSLVDGFNLPLSISRGGCPSPSCGVDINSICPGNLAIGGPNGGVIGCRSDPSLFKSRCPDAYASPGDPSTKNCITGGDYVITFCP